MSSKSKSENAQWTDTTKRFVGFMDIMGFKDMVARRTHSQVRDLLLQLSQLTDILQLTAVESPLPDSEKHDQRLRSLIFSDSILFLTKSDSIGDLAVLLDVVATFQAAALQRGTPTKGAIAVGTFTADFRNSLFFGQPLIDAYLLQEELYYYGVVLHSSAESILPSRPGTTSVVGTGLGRLIRCETALKAGRVTHYNVRITNVNVQHIDKLYGTVSGSVRRYVDNTRDFLKLSTEP